MVGFEVTAVLLVGTVVAAYFERVSLKADANKLIGELRSKETVVRAQISADVAKVIAAAKADAEKVDRNPVLTSALALVEKIEADLKKVL